MPPAEAPMPIMGKGVDPSAPSRVLALAFLVVALRAACAIVCYLHPPAFEDALDQSCIRFVFFRSLAELSGELGAIIRLLALSHAPGEFGSLLVRPQQAPQDLVRLDRLSFHDGVGGKRVPGMAPIAQHVTVFDLPQRPVAFRACKHREFTKSTLIFHGRMLLCGDRRLHPDGS